MKKSLKHNKKQSKHQSGFTLIEMIVTVTIAATLAAIAIPSFTKMIENNRISTGTNEFLAALILARSEAVKRSSSVIVCSSSNSTTCSTSTEFATGWIIYPDCDDDGVLDTTKTCDMNGDGDVADAVDMSEKDAIIKVHGALPQLSVKSGTLTPSIIRIRYDASGRSNPPMTIKIGKDANTITRLITVSLTGRVKSEHAP